MYLVSACLAGINCRYDGKSTINLELEELVRNGKAIALCPEVIAGLNIPRDSCEIIATNDGEKKVISKEKKDLTEAFMDGAQKTLAIAKTIGIKTAILKSRSPSCGCGQVYDGEFNGTLKKGNGVTVEVLMDNGIKVYTEENYMEIFGSGLNPGAKL